jgi:hypothetical protein
MPTTTMPLPTVGALALTRAALGAGVALLVADRLDPRTRRVAGWGLLAVGVVSTIPVVAAIVTGIASPDTSEA